MSPVLSTLLLGVLGAHCKVTWAARANTPAPAAATRPAATRPAATPPAVAAPSGAQASLDFPNTWVFAIGVLNWADDHLAEFPTAGRKDLELTEMFKRKGVPADHVVFLSDRDATLAGIRARLPAFLDRAPAGSTLVFYFAGHGVRDDGHLILTNYDIDSNHAPQTGYTMAELSRTLLGHWHGNRAILLGDMCHSGGLGEVVNTLEAAGKGIHAAAVTSADLHMLSTGRWTFTETLLRVFGGDAMVDTDADGRVELSEVDAFVQNEMRFREHQITHAIRGASFEPDFVFSTRVGNPFAVPTGMPWRVGQYPEASWRGQWYTAQVIDARANQVKITYPGFGAQWDEWVGADRLRVPAVGQQYAVGSRVQVEWKKQWYPATVLQVDYEFHVIHYDNYSAEWDEVVTPSRMRPIPPS